MDTLIQIAQILFILSILVILHEFGHYIAARIFKVRVEKFYLFMDPWFSLVKKQIKDTEWGIGWLPIGGYVKLSGMIDESMDSEQMAQPAQPWEFRSKPAWQRLIIMLGGIFVNLILAWFIYSVMYCTYGQKYISSATFQKNGLAFSESAQAAGFKNGDKVLSVDGKTQTRFNRLVLDVLLGEKVTIERAGTKQILTITDVQKSKILGSEGKNFMAPRFTGVYVDSFTENSEVKKAGLMIGDQIVVINKQNITYFDELSPILDQNKTKDVEITVVRNNQETKLVSKVTSEGKLGFSDKHNDTKKLLVTNKLTLAQAIPEALHESYTMFVYKIKEFKLLLSPKTEAYKQVKSPIGITQLLPVTWDWEFVWSFTAMFSIGLAFMNLLPIPGLDGGHALFTIAEMITGKTLSLKAAERVQTIGMIFLLSLMALTFGKDIYEIVIRKFS